MTWGEHLRSIRRARGLTQQELAQRLGVRQWRVSELEGRALPPSVRTLQRLAEALEMPFEQLLLPAAAKRNK